jgi:hypothetical protein
MRRDQDEPTDDDEEPEPRKGLPSLAWVGIIAIMAAGVLMLGTFCLVVSRASIRKAETVRTEPIHEETRTEPIPKTAPPPVDAYAKEEKKTSPVVPSVIEAETMKVIDLGDVQLTASAKVTTFSDENYGIHNGLLLVTLTLKNPNPAKIVDVWTQHLAGKVVDDLGNEYLELTAKNQFGSPLFVMRQTLSWGKPTRLRTEKDGTDLVFFETPLALASTITLTLDAKKYGRKGTIRLIVPKAVYATP